MERGLDVSLDSLGQDHLVECHIRNRPPMPSVLGLPLIQPVSLATLRVPYSESQRCKYSVAPIEDNHWPTLRRQHRKGVFSALRLLRGSLKRGKLENSAMAIRC
jgi:hypothetical protein